MELSRWIGYPASACAANPIALATPCHRVVSTDGDLAGYRWGIERKPELIGKEAMT
jgi:AraC family transcriptional regulator, regulatory protein of adaptative response / methylated-DNA-[protein]-cysteine methyltransferase